MGTRHGPGAPLRGVLRVLDTADGQVEEVLAWTPPAAEHPGPEEHAELTGAEREGDLLVQCTRTGVLWIDLARMVVQRAWSHPLLHDVHHALPLPGGRLAVAATGHDSVLVFDGERLEAWHWLGEGARSTYASAGEAPPPPGFEARYGRIADWRTVPFDRFKPHPVHPNHLVVVDGRLWVTGLTDASFREVGGGRRVVFPEGGVHDGRWLDGQLWFTAVGGQVIVLDPALQRAATVDVAALDRAPGLAGWCRGVERAEGRLFVGFTTLRSTRHRELLRGLVRGKAGQKRPTRVCEVLEGGVRSWELPEDTTLYTVGRL